MHKNRKKIGFATTLMVVAFVLSKPAMADHQNIHSPASAIRLQDLISEALKNNAALRASDQAGVVKEATVGPAGALENPELAFEVRNYPAGGGSESSMREREVSLSQKIPFPGKRARIEDTARKDAEAQREEARGVRAMIIKDMKNAFYELFVNYRALDVLTDQQNTLRSIISTARKQYSLGKIPQADVLNLQLEEATIEGHRLTIDRKIKSTLGEINHLLGRTDHGLYIVGRPEEIKKTPFKFDSTSEAKIFERATSKNPKVASRRAKVAASESKVAYSDLNMWPDFDFKVGYTFRDRSYDPESNNSVSAMVGVSLPLWGGSRQSEEKRRTVAERSEAQAMLNEEQIDLAHHIHLTYAELEETSGRLELFENAALPLSKQALSSAQNGYLTGRVEFSILLGLIQKRSQLELEYAEGLATYQMKIAELESLTGESLEGK